MGLSSVYANRNTPVPDPGFPVKGSPDEPLEVPIRIKDPTRWRRAKLLTLDEAAKALRVDEAQIADWVRTRRLGARWLRAGDMTVPAVARAGVDEISRRLKTPFTGDDLGEDWLIRHSARFGDCPHCENSVELKPGRWLFVAHLNGGVACAGGIHGVCNFPIKGDPFSSYRIRFGADADQWLDDHGWLLLEEALDLLDRPDAEVRRAIGTETLRSRWVRHDGEAHPLINRADVEKARTGRSATKVRKARTWYAAWHACYNARVKDGLERCRRCGRDDVPLRVSPIDEGRFNFDNSTILCAVDQADFVDPDTDDLVGWRHDLLSLREEELERPEAQRWGYAAAIERGAFLAAKYETPGP